jgi:hypothetical protein
VIETISLTGARHLSLPGAVLPGAAAQRRKRLIVLALLALLLVSALVVGGLLFKRWQLTGGQVSGEASTGTVSAGGLPELPPPNLLRPLTPEEALKANASRPVEAVPGTPATPFKLTGDQISKLRAIDCLTQAVYYEAASEGVDGGRAVAQVVLNRMRHPGYPNSVCGVVYQGSERTTGCQFTFTCDGALARTPVGYLWARSRMIASEALAGRIFAPVGYSTHYHADYVVPYWAASLDKAAVIGRHIFYRLRGSSGTRNAFRQSYAGREPVLQLPSPEVIADSLNALENVTAPSEILEEPKVEEDRIEAIAPDQKAKENAGTSLEADLARGQLILGEAVPGSKAKPRGTAESSCNSGPVQQIRPIGSTVSRVGAETSGC